VKRSVLCGLALGCAPLTFSNEASVDFERYARVRVVVAGPDGSANHADYLAGELAAHSGFSAVTRDTLAPVDAVLTAELSLSVTGDDLFDDDDTAYSATVLFRLVDSSGALVDSGSGEADEESNAFVAAEFALDQVVLHYLPAYRL
jgi:hypothetical protein